MVEGGQCHVAMLLERVCGTPQPAGGTHTACARAPGFRVQTKLGLGTPLFHVLIGRHSWLGFSGDMGEGLGAPQRVHVRGMCNGHAGAPADVLVGWWCLWGVLQLAERLLLLGESVLCWAP